MPIGDKFPVLDVDDLKSFLVFIGHPISGHTLVGSIIDAHPQAIVSHEYKVFEKTRTFLRRRDGARTMMREILGNSYSRRNGRMQTMYNYTIPGWSGRATNLTIVGDKAGGGFTLFVKKLPNKMVPFLELGRLVQLPLKVMHVVRDPLDQIATYRISKPMFSHVTNLEEECYCGEPDSTNPIFSGKMDPWKLALDNYDTNNHLISRGELDVFTSHHDDMNADPVTETRRIITWLGFPECRAYERAVDNMVQHSSRRASDHVDWTVAQLTRVLEVVKRTPFLSRYQTRVEGFLEEARGAGGTLCKCQPSDHRADIQKDAAPPPVRPVPATNWYDPHALLQHPNNPHADSPWHQIYRSVPVTSAVAVEGRERESKVFPQPYPDAFL